MNPADYVAIVDKTAIYPNEVRNEPSFKGVDYAKLGLIGEFGEVCNKIKKVYRDQDGIFHLNTVQEIAKEQGDIYWYLAALCRKEFDLSFVASYEAAKKFQNPFDKSLFKTLYKCQYYISQICLEESHVEVTGMNIIYVLSCLDKINSTLGLDTEDILQMNYDKLSKRLESNTLQGSGDNR